MVPFRVGFGYDVHQLVEGRDLWLGGVLIPHEKGALGHSDADVLLHAICDALLGAAALGDIGKHFPDTSADFKGIDSKILLKKTCDLIRENGYEIGNIDSTLCLERPKVMKHAEQMKSAISEVAGIDVNQVSIKATTSEKMGFVGREEGVNAYAVALIYLV
ncbi:MAG: 2-C-methyl-D-erythritol 2,4-cyclodiphosphate synthase [Flavobacteriales bacterium]|jgi:2-C-methyl-D-erythritol 2,4-cyclodiphosphate synthase